MIYERKKILIWGMTYPTLSSKYIETVCTGGILEDGRPIRLHPIPYRYLDWGKKFHKYQWIEADITKNPQDTRPESYKIKKDSIKPLEIIKPNSKDGWAARASAMFKYPGWQFTDMDDLNAAHEAKHISIGVVRPKNILDVQIAESEEEEKITFEQKMEKLLRQKEINDQQMKFFKEETPKDILDLDFMESRLRIHWECHSPNCRSVHHGHKMQITDWEVMELQRREGTEAAREKLIQVIDPDEHDIRFFLGNLFLHPNKFMIVGLWYPKIASTPTFL